MQCSKIEVAILSQRRCARFETSSSGAPAVGAPGSAAHGTILQGALEASNVNVVEELVSMIETQRAYEVNSKAISSVDGMLKFLTQNV